MHYANGREAKENDPVVFPNPNSPGMPALVGKIYGLNPNSETCNGLVSFTKMGGTDSQYVNVKDGYHADDALAAIQPKIST